MRRARSKRRSAFARPDRRGSSGTTRRACGSHGSGSSTDPGPASSAWPNASRVSACRRIASASGRPPRSSPRLASSCSSRRTARRAFSSAPRRAAAKRAPRRRPSRKSAAASSHEPASIVARPGRSSGTGDRTTPSSTRAASVQVSRGPGATSTGSRRGEAGLQRLEAGGRTVDLAREERAEAGTGGEDRAPERSALHLCGGDRRRGKRRGRGATTPSPAEARAAARPRGPRRASRAARHRRRA